MYAKYVYLNTSTIEQIHDDMFEMFCGETNINNLSASCDTSNSFIRTNLSVSPWVDYDDVSINERIMRMEMSDDSGVYKYVGWHWGETQTVGLAVMESWDAGTDTPTNEHPAEFNYQSMQLFLTTGGTIHIYSSQFCTIMMHQSTTDLWGNTSTPVNYGSLGIFECSRDHPSLAVGDMPNWFIACTAMFWGDSDANMDAIFWKGRDSTDTVKTPFLAMMGYPSRSNAYSDTNSYPITGGAGSSTALTEIGADTAYGLEPIIVGGAFAETYDAKTFYGNVSSRCDIWMMPVGSEPCGSLIDIGPDAYFVFKAGYTTGTTGAQFGGKFIVPYG